MTPQQIATATGATLATATAWAGAINAACEQFQINTPRRQAAFLAQIGVESAGLTELVENLNYSAAALLLMWPARFTPADATAYGRTLAHPADQVMIANIAYANRMGNGDVSSGDGWRFRGRGLIQLTGRWNYRRAGFALHMPLEANPDLVAQPQGASLTAAWYWAQHGCNAMADAGHFIAITQAINGGTNGLPARQALYAQALSSLTTA